MAKTVPPWEIAKSKWHSMEVQCPICKKTFKSWYCPDCGLPKNNSGYFRYEDEIHYCGSNHFRRGFGKVQDYELCSKCYTPNPYNAKYCRNCREDMTLQARDKKGYAWVDLGLSVLWASETYGHSCYYRWNDPDHIYDICDYQNNLYYNRRYDPYNYESEVDVATKLMGDKWRTPTKEEFDELIQKCKWEKCLTPVFKRYALKAIGPNGNSIIIGSARFGEINYLGETDQICLWTATSISMTRAVCFKFQDWYKIWYDFFYKILYFRELREDEPIPCRKTVEYIDKVIKNIEKQKKLIYSKLILKYFKEIIAIIKENKYTLTSNSKKKCRAIFDEISHIINTHKKELWMETTPIIPSNEGGPFPPNIKRESKEFSYAIHPVIDKKWQGNI